MPNTTVEPTSIYPLYHALTRRLIPWSEMWETQRIVVARPTYKEMLREDLPRGIQVARREISEAAADEIEVRFYNYTIPTDHFPEDGMVATHLPVIACVINGTAQLEAGNYAIHCEEGSFVIFPPQLPHPDGSRPHVKDKLEGQGASDIFWMYHWKEGIICHICHSRGETHVSPQNHEECYVTSQQALLCFEVMIEEMAKPQMGDLRVYKSLVLALLIILRREFEVGNYIQPGAAVVESSLSLAEDPILRAAHYIQFHLNEPLTIDALARKYYMSRSQFTKRFRDTIGMTFLAFLTEQRVLKVKSLLRDTDWSLETICNLSGLKLSNLRVLLRTHTGLSPLEYRRQSRAQNAGETSGVEN